MELESLLKQFENLDPCIVKDIWSSAKEDCSEHEFDQVVVHQLRMLNVSIFFWRFFDSLIPSARQHRAFSRQIVSLSG